MPAININGFKELIFLKTLELEKITFAIKINEANVNGQPIKYLASVMNLLISKGFNWREFRRSYWK